MFTAEESSLHAGGTSSGAVSAAAGAGGAGGDAAQGEHVFACTVGQKPSKAPFYVNDPSDVLAALSKLADASGAPAAPPAASPSVSFA